MYSIEEFDEQKTRVMKFVLYKKRTEQEVRTKFRGSIDDDMLDDIIDYLKDAKYLNDKEYIEKAINYFMGLKNLSLVELKNKLYTKGISRDDVEDYFYDNKEKLEKYEIQSAQNIKYKKQGDLNPQEIRQYLLKKGYKLDNLE